MPGRTAFISILVVLLLPLQGWATLIVDPPQPITQRVTVQIVRTATDDGSTLATLFGTPTQESNIKARIDQIWAQAGIDIDFLSEVTQWNSTFAYQGNAGAGTRPTGDLDSIITLGNSAGVVNTTPTVLNVFFVEVVPSFTPLDENTAAGYAKIGGDGIAYTVGNVLPTFQNGRDVVASVLAHEIGHNLGLNHPANGLPNLMSPMGTTQQLTSAQISTALASSFSIPIPVLLGDYNQNDVIDAADYTVWRDLMTTGGTLPNDPTPGSITESDFTYWRTHFGESLGGGSGASSDLLAPLSSPGGPNAVPEPATGLLLTVALLLLAASRRRRRR